MDWIIGYAARDVLVSRKIITVRENVVCELIETGNYIMTVVSALSVQLCPNFRKVQNVCSSDAITLQLQ